MTEPTDVERFARAVVRAGGNALLINQDNTSGRWVSIPEAVASGQAFAVEVKQALIALDLDSEELVAAGAQAAEFAEASGCATVWVASGRNRHLYINAGDDSDVVEEHLQAMLPGIVFRDAIRPPLSPHRLGKEVRLISPGTVTGALEALGAPEAPRPLAPWVERLLVLGGEDNRSAMALKIASGFKAAGKSFYDYERAILSPANAGGEKAQELDATGRDPKFLRRTWDKAEAHTLTRAATRDRIQQLRERVQAAAWNGRNGRTDHRVLLALLDYAEAAPTLAPTPGERRLTELAQLGSRNTLRKSLDRLETAGWLRREDSPPAGTAYRLVSKLNHSSTRGTVKLWFNSDTLHPAFRDGKGLGSLTGRVWGYMMKTGRPTVSADVMQAVGCSRSSTQRALRKLCDYELAVKSHGSYTARGTVENLDRLADELGVFDRIERQHKAHQAERDCWEAEQAKWKCPVSVNGRRCGTWKHKTSDSCADHEAERRRAEEELLGG